MEEQAKQQQTWWQKVSKPLAIAGIIVACALVILLVVALIGGYLFNWDWTGFSGGVSKVTTTIITPEATTVTPGETVATEQQPAKTLWDWLGLLGILAIPVVVGFGVALFTAQQAKESEANREKRHQTDLEIAEKNREREQETAIKIAADNQHEAAFRAYIDKMSELLIERKLAHSAQDDRVRNIARIQTLAVLIGLDGIRKRSVLQFLYEAGLINKDKGIVDLRDADLSSANLSRATLVDADLSGANLSSANLSGAYMHDANLFQTDLRDADLSGANLQEIDLTDANLSGANLSGANLVKARLGDTRLDGANLSGAYLNEVKYLNVEWLEKKAKSLKGATMPDESKHP